METVALVAPITCLEFLQDKFLLTGEGPVLLVYRLQPHPVGVTSLSILHHYRIHGIRPRSQSAVQSSATEIYKHGEHEKRSITEPNFYDLAVFGGKAVRLVRLHVNLQDVEHLRLEVLGPLFELRDWALDVRWLSGEKHLLCAAVAHNAALLLDVVKGNVLVQCACFEGCLLYSAFLVVHEAWADTVLVGGTVFNQLVIWKPGGGHEVKDSGFKAPVERRLLGHSGVIFSISYLQSKGYLASASDDRSVRVWDVGALGGPRGTCGNLNPTCLRVLYGHQARVFSVHLSPRRVFSAGEDGACLVWDSAGGGKVIRTLKGHRAGGVRALAVSVRTEDYKRWVATGGADGGVNLWKVEGGEMENVEEAASEKLTDLKFPDYGLPKIVSVAGEEGERTRRYQVVVCTDRGIVCQYRDGNWETLWQGPSDFQSYCVMDTVSVFVKDSTTTVNLCAVGNLSGSIQVFLTSQPHAAKHLTAGSGKIHSIIWQKRKDSVYLLASGADGLVYRWVIEVNKVKENCLLVVTVAPLAPFLLPHSAKRWLTAAVCSSSSSETLLWVCGDRRGSLLLFQEGEHLGQKTKEEGNEVFSRTRRLADNELKEAKDAGGKRMMVKDESKDVDVLKPLSCLFGVHGKHGVTSVCEYQGLLYSAGKDGFVRVVRVTETLNEKPPERQACSSGIREETRASLQLEVLRVQRACKGMEWLEKVLFLESEISLEEETECKNQWEAGEGEQSLIKQYKGREGRFVIAGFQAANFMIWDPLRQERLMVVPCGGGHRSWSLWPSHTGIWPEYGALVFIKQGAVLTSQPPGETPGCAEKEETTSRWSLREGIHGRGIWCVCRLGRIEEWDTYTTEKEKCKTDREERYWEVVVTGGEDTSLAVLAINPVSGTISVLSVITDHISGVRAVTAITHSEGGRENQTGPLSALLLSAGGRAQIQCYRLLVVWDRQRRVPSCQVIQVAGHRLDMQWEKRRNRHKTVKMDPETRYLSIEVLEEKSDRVLLALSCSDGAVRLFSVSKSKNQVDLLKEMFYHQRCVLSVAPCSLEDDRGNRYKLLFSAATDGNISVWHLTEAEFLSTDHSSGATTPPIPCLDIPAHQSGINSLAVWVEKLGRQEGGCLVTVASGGDDGQLTVSTVRVQYPQVGETGGSRGFSVQVQTPNRIQLRLHSQSHIPLAHAAPLTALKLLSPGLLVSTSSDQRVCLWKVSGTNINHRGALCSHVADAAGLAVWEGEEGHEKGETRFETEQVNEACEGKVDPVCENGDENGFEATGDPRNQTESDAEGAACSKTSCKSRKKRPKVGWVLVCGQGFQLLRLTNEEIEEELWKKENLQVKVTLQKRPHESAK